MLVFSLAICLLAAAPLQPVPQHAEWKEGGGFELSPGMPIVVADYADESVTDAAALFAKSLPVECPVLSASEHNFGDPAIYVGLDEDHPAQGHRRLWRFIRDIGDPGPQGYRLAVTRRFVVLAAPDMPGLHHGLRALATLAQQGSISEGEVSNHPELEIRGAALDGLPEEDELDALSARYCNLLTTLEPVPYPSSAAANGAWVDCGRLCRGRGIDFAPTVDIRKMANTFLEEHPDLAVAVGATESVRLEGTLWTPLENRNVLRPQEYPIRVSIRGDALQEGVDYAVHQEEPKPPYSAKAAPCFIERLPDGALEDGAVVTVEYAYIPPGTSRFSIGIPAVREALKGYLQALRQQLPSAYIHLGAGPWLYGREDVRSDLQDDGPDALIQAFASLLQDSLGGESRFLLTPANTAEMKAWQNARQDLPLEIVLVVPHDELPDDLAQGRTLATADAGNPPAAYAAVNTAAQREDCAGVLITGASNAQESGDLMAKAWHSDSLVLLWPEYLNRLFGSQLWTPDFPAILDAQLAYLNWQTLQGAPPDEVMQRFREDREAALEALPRGRRALLEKQDHTEARLFEQLTRWVALEAETNNSHQDWRRLVETQAALDPELDGERAARMLELMEQTGRHIPASILFNRFVYPWRPVNLPEGERVLPVAVEPEYIDRAGEAIAIFHMAKAPGPLYRVDFDTAGATEFTLEAGLGPEDCRVVLSKQAQLGEELLPPLMPEPVEATYVRVTVRSSGPSAVLRDARLCCIKTPSRAACPELAEPVDLNGDFKEKGWPIEADIKGFVREGTREFAKAQTVVRLAHDDKALYVGAYMLEPRMTTRAARHETRDAPSEQDESFEVVLQPADGQPAARFLVNMLGVKADSRGGDMAWNPEWGAAVRDYREGWAAEIRIPFRELPQAAGSGTWHADFVRHRRNVIDEDSSWTFEQGDAPSGIIRFE